MSKSTFDNPIFSLAPGEMAQLQAREFAGGGGVGVYEDEEMTVLDPFVVGTRNWLAGAAANRMVMTGENVFSYMSGRDEAPLNLTKFKKDLDPLKDDTSYFLDNNPEKISEQLQSIPFSEIPWVLNASSHREYLRRLEYVKTSLPEQQEKGSNLGFAAGLVTDIGLGVAFGAAVEPLVLTRLGVAGMAGRAAGGTLGRTGSLSQAAAIAEATATVSRLGLTGRYAALGIGETAAYHLARFGIDPMHEPTAGQLAFEATLGGGIAGLVGGAAFGKRFVRMAVEEAVEDINRTRRTVVTGLNGETYTINWGAPYAFGSPVHADTVLFGAGTGSFEWEASQVGRALWNDWQQTGDLFIPGSRSTHDLFVVGGTFPSGTVRPGGQIINFPPFAEAANAVAPDSPLRLGIPFEVAGDKVWRTPLIELTRFGERVHLGFDDVSALSELVSATVANRRPGGIIPAHLSEQAGSRIRVEFEPVAGMRGRVAWPQAWRQTPTQEMYSRGEFTLNLPYAPDLIRQGIRSIKVNTLGRSADEIVSIRNTLANGGFREVASTAADDLTFVPNTLPRSVRPALTTSGARSVIKVIANEIQQSGVELTGEIFERIALAVARAERSKLAGEAFNERLWTEVSAEFNNMAGLDRMTGRIIDKQVPMIGGIDRTLQDVAARADLVDSVWSYYRNGSWQAYMTGGQQSLIFQVLHEIGSRGGRVDRRVVGEVINELREISQNPPKRLNAKGVRTLDTPARRQAVNEVINRRVPLNSQKIYIPEILARRLAPSRAAINAARQSPNPAMNGGNGMPPPPPRTPPAGGGGIPPTGGGRTPPAGGGGGGAPPAAPAVGGAADASDTPVNTTRIPLLDRLGNQAAFVMQSQNGWARLVANLMFFANRDLGTAQAWTQWEQGTFRLLKMQTAFAVGYRNAFVRFALGDGNTNILRKVDLVDKLKTMFSGRALREQFDTRVAQQMRHGRFDDPLDAVNEFARGYRDIFRAAHTYAHEAGVRGFMSNAVNNYFPRLWRYDRIRTLGTTSQGRQTLKDFVRTLIDQNGRRVVIDGVEHSYAGDIDEAAEVISRRLLSIANDTENAPLTAQDQALVDAIGDLDGPIKAANQSRSPFGRARIIMDESAMVSTVGGADLLALGRSTLTLEDLTHTDLGFVTKKYLSSVIGAANERHLINSVNEQLTMRGVLGPVRNVGGVATQEPVKVETIAELIDLIDVQGGVPLSSAEKEAIRELVAAIRYEPLRHGKTSLADKGTEALLGIGYNLRGGQFGFAQFSEIARVIGTYGIRSTMRQIPIIADMVKNWKNLDQGASNFASTIDHVFNPAGERLRRVISSGYQNLQPYEVPGSRMAEKMFGRSMNFMRRANDLQADLGGLAPATSFLQTLATATTIQHFYDVAKGTVKAMDESTIRLLGLTKAQYDNVVAYVGANATTTRQFGFDRVSDLANSDTLEMRHLIAFADRATKTRIQSIPTRGDFHKELFSNWARIATQFRTFNLKGIDNFLLANTSRVMKGTSQTRMRVLSEIGFTAMAAGLIQYARNKIAYETAIAAGNYEKADEIESRMDFEGIARGAVSGPSEFFLPAMMTDTAAWLADEDPVFSPYRYSGLSAYSFPAFANASNAILGVKDLLSEDRITRGTIQKFRSLAPFAQLPGISSYYDIKAEEIADALDAPRVRPRIRE